MENAFYQIAAILLVAVAAGGVALALRQPLIVAFIFVGIAVGPAGLGIVEEPKQIELLSTMGIALLLFVVGLKLDLQLIRTLGPAALATGLGQVLFTSAIGYFIALALGFGGVASVYIAIALTFSSTIIVVKLLSDKREIDSLHGRIAVGLLIVQDIVVVLTMIVLSAFGMSDTKGVPWRDLLQVLAKGAVLIAVLALLMRFVIPGLTHRMARSTELLVLFGIAWAVVCASLGDYLGFGREVGAFLAGVSLASTPYRESISTRLVSLRDFLLLFFFIDLGARLDLELLGAHLLPAAVFSVFVLIGKPLIVTTIMGAMGYRKRTGSLAGMTVAQISEFSLILGALGLGLGHIEAETFGLITLVGLITICLSTYMILYAHPLYEHLAPFLGLFERRVPHREEAAEASGGETPEVILFGLGRFGANIAHGLRAGGVRVLGIDFDPEAVRQWRREGLPARYGDAEDPELHSVLPLRDVAWVVCAIPDRDTNLALLDGLRQHGYRGHVALTAHHAYDAKALQERGASVVLHPFLAAAEQTAATLLAHMRMKAASNTA